MEYTDKYLIMNCLKKKKGILFVTFCGVNAPTNPTSLNMGFGREARDLLLGANMRGLQHSTGLYACLHIPWFKGTKQK